MQYRETMATKEQVFARHPCFGAARNRGRIHLPVCPVCNISCNFCVRSLNEDEDRPGVTAQVISPEEAVEVALARELYAFPRHPYTKALLSAVPVADPRTERTRRRILLEGDPPSPVDLPGGCRFCGRCPYVKPLCREKLPSLKEITPGHFLACHRGDI